jgi:hypothetical protein
MDSSNLLSELNKRIQDPIKNSELVRNLTADLTKQIETLTADLKSYKYAYEQGKKYEDYYNLHYKMEHGNET